MLIDLLPKPISPISRTRWIARQIAIAISVVFALGMAGVGTGRTIDSRLPTTDKPQPQPVLSSNHPNRSELLHEIPTSPASDNTRIGRVRPSIAIPSLISHHRGRIVMMEVTAYCPCPKCCGPEANGITASGKLVSYNAGRFVAADTSVLPFGTKLLIPGYDSKPVEVIDRGGAIKGNKLDVFFPTHEQALKWGRRFIAVTVVE